MGETEEEFYRTTSFCLNPRHFNYFEDKEINKSEFVRKAIDREISRRQEGHECPFCGLEFSDKEYFADHVDACRGGE